MTRTLAADVLLVVTAGGLLAVAMVCWDCLVFLIRTRTRGEPMRLLAKGDVIRLKINLPTDTVVGVRSLQAGYEFEVISAADGYVKCFDGNGVKSLLPEHAVEFVRAAHSPESGNRVDAGKRASTLPVRRGLGRPSEVGS